MPHQTTDCASLPSLHCSAAAAWRLTAAATSAEAAAPAASTPREPLSWFWSAAATFWALMAGGGSWGRTRSKACWLTLHRVASGERWTQGLAFAGQRLVLSALVEFCSAGRLGIKIALTEPALPICLLRAGCCAWRTETSTCRQRRCSQPASGRGTAAA